MFVNQVKDIREILIVDCPTAGAMYTVFLKVRQIVLEAKTIHSATASDKEAVSSQQVLLSDRLHNGVFYSGRSPKKRLFAHIL
jgi:hypothetical protein